MKETITLVVVLLSSIKETITLVVVPKDAASRRL
jgi:hypothetical protein